MLGWGGSGGIEGGTGFLTTAIRIGGFAFTGLCVFFFFFFLMTGFIGTGLGTAFVVCAGALVV